MALKSSIYKIQMDISDIDRSYYQQHSVTVACHPSENEDRLMVRILAFALHADERLAFGNGITDRDEPDLFLKDYSGTVTLSIEVGLPDDKQISKFANRSEKCVVYAYSTQPNVWWAKTEPGLLRIQNLSVYAIDMNSVKELAGLAEKNMKLQFTIQEGQVNIYGEKKCVQLQLRTLRE